MAWTLDSDRPIYLQLVEVIQMRIVSGTYQAGSRLPSVRELATEAGVNPNTMQKALSELERSGLVITQRTSGRTVTENASLIGNIRQSLAKEQMKLFFQKMKKLGYKQPDIAALIKQADEEGNI
ncbi:MAG: GntR family transcriptional regulator [Clostridiales bacterium]|nr:GntR family transcriptional regulator [Clostridiales bacterium]